MTGYILTKIGYLGEVYLLCRNLLEMTPAAPASVAIPKAASKPSVLCDDWAFCSIPDLGSSLGIPCSGVLVTAGGSSGVGGTPDGGTIFSG